MSDSRSKNRPSITLDGVVESGQGAAKEFITLPGYARQFRERLGYEPYPGTLNLAVDGDRFATALQEAEGIRIDAWSDGDDEFGGASCVPVTVGTDERSSARCHLIVPDRSRYEAVAEIMAPNRLRDVLDVSDGDPVSVEFE